MSSLSTQLTGWGWVSAVSVREFTFVCVWFCLYVQPCMHTHLHVFLFKCPLVVFPWLSVGYISAAESLGTQQQTSLSTVVYISFPCLHVVLNCPRKERDSLCDPSVATDAVEMLKWWCTRAYGVIPQSFSLHLRLTDTWICEKLSIFCE